MVSRKHVDIHAGLFRRMQLFREKFDPVIFTAVHKVAGQQEDLRILLPGVP